jgi:hypothetical protein
VQWLLLSLVLSLVLTLALNIVVRLIPGGARRTVNWLDDLSGQHSDEPTTVSRSRVRVVVPWKTMIALSILLTVAINMLLWAK